MSREQVLHDIRRAISETGIRGQRQLPPRPAGPEYGEGLVGQFTERLLAHTCSFEELDRLDEVPERALGWLLAKHVPKRIAIAPPLAALPWPDDIERHSGPAGIDEQVAVSLAFAGIAETGSLAMYSGPSSPITHNYVPEFHLIVLFIADLMQNQEGVWAKVRESGAMPRALNLIAGPSRTGDVEQTIQIGAHGPRQVHVMLVHEKPTTS